MNASALLNKVKTALRIGHNKLDGELEDWIESALDDLRLAGVIVRNDGDALILAAVKTYCRAHMTDDVAKSEMYLGRYDRQKSTLKATQRYGTYTAEEADGDAE